MKKLMLRLALLIPVSFLIMGNLLISGCSSSQPKKIYYQLPASTITSEVSRIDTNQERQLWVKRVHLVDYLASSGIVYQTGDVTYSDASNHLWASPLEQQLQQILVNQLSAAFPQRLVSDQPIEKNADALDVTITAFHGRYDGRVIIQGYWVLSNQKEAVKRAFNLELKQTKDGYAELVRALATGYHQLTQSIASQIASQG
ncbi:membrane integrity-associated transporter subunit PqiC [Xenorhabdus budapestensis]|uniref:Membrane protein n=1 Tax=Xenorhabdus budapestensis TaxID=290110 RepID=A0A2D0J4I7_XENBU|nr:membrane integrity-associated transporter subunit PqiC [Xenorhabdus budapestensis]PHM29405.1 membrane protein [Xenorhabdus budapestensis]